MYVIRSYIGIVHSKSQSVEHTQADCNRPCGIVKLYEMLDIISIPEYGMYAETLKTQFNSIDIITMLFRCGTGTGNVFLFGIFRFFCFSFSRKQSNSIDFNDMQKWFSKQNNSKNHLQFQKVKKQKNLKKLANFIFYKSQKHKRKRKSEEWSQRIFRKSLCQSSLWMEGQREKTEKDLLFAWGGHCHQQMYVWLYIASYTYVVRNTYVHTL